jgi:hypothetical protein
MITLLFAVLSFNTFAFASSCEPVDFRKSLGEPRDQANTSWCFAHSTADLLTQLTGVRVSAFDLATQFVASDVRSLLRSKSPAVREYLSVHPELLTVIDEARRDSLGSLEPAVLLTENGFLSHGGIEDGSMLLANERDLCEDQFFEDGEEGFEKLLVEIRLWVNNAGFSAAPDNWAEVPVGSRKIFSQVLGWVDHKCGSRRNFAGKILPDSFYIANSVKDFYAKTSKPDFPLAALQAEVKRRVDQNLDAGKVSAIGYNAFDLTEQSEEEELEDGDHSSIVAARRPRGNSCEYFIRNSWGEDCSLYLAPWKERCEAANGGIWATLEEIPTLYSVVSYQ